MSIWCKLSRVIEGLLFMFLHCQLERPGYKGTKQDCLFFHLVKLVWKVNWENKKKNRCQRNWPNTVTLIILLRIEKNYNINIAWLQDCVWLARFRNLLFVWYRDNTDRESLWPTKLSILCMWSPLSAYPYLVFAMWILNPQSIDIF